MKRDALIAVMVAASLGACSPATTADAPTPADTGSDMAAAAPVLAYADAFVMEPIGGRDMTMGGVTLSVENAAVRLVSAASPAIGTIELHTMQMADGKMQMRQVDGFDIRPGEPLTLKRGGNHFMMFDVGEAVVGGQTIDLTLEFATEGEDSLTLVVPADVRVVGE